jgi:lactate dehydrogenase-like 2-hydroxyacid dehydrogenase
MRRSRWPSSTASGVESEDEEEVPVNIGVLGTGMVGKAIGTKLVVLGHEVRMGSRTADNEEAAAWVSVSGSGASQARLPRPPA